MKNASFIFEPANIVDNVAIGTGRARGAAISQGRRKAVILATARRMIGESGCASVRMRQLAERSDVTPPTLYALVGSRHDVVRQALLEGLEAKFTLAEGLAEVDGINPILAFGEVKWSAIAHDPNYYRQIVRGTAMGVLDLSTVAAIHDAIAARFLLWFRQMSAEGMLREDLPFQPATVAPLLARQFAVPVASWATERISLGKLRSDIRASLALPLFGVAAASEVERMTLWLGRAEAAGQ